MSVLAALALVGMQPATAAPVAVQAQTQNGTGDSLEQGRDPLAEKVEQASELLKRGQAADAVPIIDQAIAAVETQHHGPQKLYCARSDQESLMYLMMAASKKVAASVLSSDECYAYFLKGFALIDLNRSDEAKPYFDKAIEFGPMNAQFLAERGEWFKSRKDWENAYSDFKAAADAAEFSPQDMKSSEQRRAWRGMAYARTEQGKLKEALQLLQKCLQLDAGDDKCKQEVDYVNGLPAKSN